jgi:hypothetical protein
MCARMGFKCKKATYQKYPKVLGTFLLLLHENMVHGLVTPFITGTDHKGVVCRVKGKHFADFKQLPTDPLPTFTPPRSLITTKHLITNFIPSICMGLYKSRITMIPQLKNCLFSN